MTSLKLSLAAVAGGLLLAASVAVPASAGGPDGFCNYGSHARTAENTDVENIDGKQSKIAETEISTPVTTPVVTADDNVEDAAETVVAADGTTSQD